MHPQQLSVYNIITFLTRISTVINKKGGASDLCKDNIRASWDVIWNWAKTNSGRIQLQKALKLCSVPVSELQANETAPWISNAISWMAMGSCLVCNM